MTVKELKKKLEKFDENQEVVFNFSYKRHKCIPGAIWTFQSCGEALLINDTITGKAEIYNRCEATSM